MDDILCIPLEKYETSEGSMMPIYRDWDDSHNGHSPKMVYATTMNPSTNKGPILHMERYEFVTAISGVVNVELMIDNKFVIYSLRDREGNSNILKIPPGIPKIFSNISKDECAVIINAPSKAWHPDNPDTFKFTSWEEYVSFKEK